MKLLRISFPVLLFIFSFPIFSLTQDMVLVVERCKALDQDSPIHNIWVDDDNIKWVANKKGLFKVMALDLVQPVSIPAGKTSLLNIRGGNAKLEWNTAELESIIGSVKITCAAYDAKSKTVWLGSHERGAFQISLSPLRLVQSFNVDNKRLTSNRVNDIFIQQNGTVWMATNDGMLTGSGDKWSLQERYLNFIGVDAWGENLWILGDDFLWQVDSRGKWNTIAIEPKNVEGELRDIAVDDEGRVWIASNMMTGFNAAINRYQRFGPGQYFTSQFVNCLDVDKDGSIWTGTDDKGLYLIQWEAAMTVNILTDKPLDCKTPTPEAAITAKITGGTPPYVFKWNTGQSQASLTSLGPGSYQLTVTDAKNIVKTAKYEIPEPHPKITMELVRASSGQPEGDGSAHLLVDGGTMPFSYEWDSGESGQTAIRLTPGKHTVTVTDAAGCSASASIDIPEKILPLVVYAKFASENKCANSLDGVAEVEVSGGKPPYTFKWTPGDYSTSKVTNLGSALYSVVVTDRNGHTASTSVNIPAPPELQVAVSQISPASVNMTNGHVEAKVSGGKPPYTYKWDSGETTATVKTFAGGNHILTVTDGVGCTTSESITVTENIHAMSVIIKQPIQISCHGDAAGSLRVMITGGKGPYTYEWSNGETTATLENLPAGDYSVTVTDVVGTSFPATTTIKQPDVVTATVEIQASATANQSDGIATVKANGGTGAYRYAWDNGEITAKAMKLNAGLRSVTVTDEAGCTAMRTMTMTENITSLAVQIQQVKAIACTGNREAVIEATVSGGKPPYTYLWSTGAISSQIQNLDKGVYTVTVTDASGQTSVRDYEITAPAPMGVEVKVEQLAGANRTDGRAHVIASGGTGKYTYKWSNGETTPRAVSLGAGKHTIHVYDDNGCMVHGEINIVENITAMNTNILEGNKIKCPGDATASLQASYSGGKAPYAVVWRQGEKEWKGDQIENIGAGSYTLEVTDAAGQVSSAQFNVTEPKPLQLNVFSIRSATNDRLKDGKASVETFGGTGSCSFQWSSGESLHQAMQLPLGPGFVIATDANGCSARAEFIIKEKVLPELTAGRLASGEPLRMEKIQFQADSVRVNEEAIPSLDELYEFLYDNPTVIIEVAGHTNSLPADEYCDRISAERADSVADYIIGKGIESRRVIAKGYGKRKPIATNQTSEGRKKNQRVEIRLIKIEE